MLAGSEGILALSVTWALLRGNAIFAQKMICAFIPAMSIREERITNGHLLVTRATK